MEPRPSDPYLHAFTRLGRRVLADRLDQALAMARRMRVDFPRQAASVAHTEACLLCLDGRVEEAVEVLAGLVGEGRWLSRRQLADPDLAPLASHPSYAGLTATMRSREDAASRAAHRGAPDVIVARPQGTIRATVVALPMLGVSGSETAAIWAPVADAGFAVVTVESALRNGDGLPCWDDMGLTERDVRSGVDAAHALGAPVVLAGGSQGAGVAARLALGGGLPGLAGFLCVVGAPSAGTWHANTRLPAALVIGGEDPLTAGGIRRFGAELAAAGVEAQVMEVPGLEHVYPDDWGGLAPPLIDRLVSQQS